LRGREFNSRSGRYQVVTTWMGDCLRTGKPSRHIINHEGQLSLLSLVSTSLLGWSLSHGTLTCVMCQKLAGNTVWSHMAGDAP